jgi:hypothetical protein
MNFSLGRMCWARLNWLFVSYLALNLLDEVCRQRLYAVGFSGMLCRFPHQLVFALRPSDIVAARYDVTATNHFGHNSFAPARVNPACNPLCESC